MTLRLMTWNILTGGGDRLPAIIEVVKAERPDILALQELRDFQRYGHRTMSRFAAEVGMTAHLTRSALGQPVGVLVRPPLEIAGRSGVRWRLHHAAAVVEVPTPSGPLTVVSTHLNPISPYRRMREAKWLAARYGGPRTVLAGDLNGLSPADDATSSLDGLGPLYRRRHLGPDGTPDTRALESFLAAGFTDVWQVAGSGDGRSVPTAGLRGHEFGAMRLDYVLAGSAVAPRARDMSVIRGGTADHASDHYPLRVDLDL